MLEIYRRGATWWARGRIEYLGAPISDYYRTSTGSATEAGARDWCRQEEQRRIRRHLLGDEKQELTFVDALELYESDPKTSEYLIPVTARIGEMLVKDISPKFVRELGRELMPMASTDTWVRQVITPVRAVINNAHDLGRCGAIRVKGYDKAERVAQDKKRGRRSRVAKTPGSWEWLLKFRRHAERRHAALALFMFSTGARISQAVEMHPKKHLDLQHGRACIPGAKGHDDRWVEIPPELVAELANLPVLYPRGWERKAENARVFGFADRSSPRKGWDAACKAAGIDRIPFHAAGRHGFGQEMNVRQPVDEKAAGEFGGWSDTGLMRRTYTHAEDTSGKIHGAWRNGLEQAQATTGIAIDDAGDKYKPRSTRDAVGRFTKFS